MQVSEHPKDVGFSGPEVNNDDDVLFAGGKQLTFTDIDDDRVEADVGEGGGEGSNLDWIIFI